MANRDELEQDYLDEWKKQFGSDEPEEGEEPGEEEAQKEEVEEEPAREDPSEEEEPEEQEEVEEEEEDDPDKELRQVGLVDAQGGSATFSGQECFAWAGGVLGRGYAIQGNILAGGKVVPAMEKAFLKTEGNLPARLYAALLAGDRAGGDKRGRQSAAIYVVKPNGGYGGYLDRWLDYRVDDHEDPVRRLGELLDMHRLYFGKSSEAQRVVLENDALRRIQEILRRLDYLQAEPTGVLDDLTKKALAAFIGNENFEERADPAAGWVDGPVLDFLLRKFENESVANETTTKPG